MSAHPTSLGPYPVERELGRGGMGVVYLARDPRLNRPVAIKVLPETLANQESLARFDREAKLLASLNHPNIATIYGVEELAGSKDPASMGSAGAPGLQTRGTILVLEYIPGDTLAGHIARGPLPLDEALDVCRQVALAIEAAHEGGVIHRDLKPGNIKITPDGQVKVLDFGLAKGSATVSDAELAHSPTMTFAATAMGVILGTAGYMSPEQARGKAVDRRTDIWSFGCVLFECLAGRQIFEGETVSDTIAKILEREPDWSALPANTPPAVRDILRRCLEKDLKKRQRDIGDVRIQLEEAAAARSSSIRQPAGNTPPTPRFGLSMKTTAIGTLLIFLGAAAGIGLWNMIGAGTGGGSSSGPIRLSISIPRSIARALVALPTNDGRFLLVIGLARNPDGTEDPIPRLYKRRIDDYEFTLVAGSEGIQSLTNSADPNWIAITKPVSPQSTARELVKLAIDGSSPPVKLANFAATWTSFVWLDNGDFLMSLSSGSSYVRLPKNSGTPGPEIPFDLGGAPGSASFGGRITGGNGAFMNVESYTSRGWSSDGWVLDFATNKARRLFENTGALGYAVTGHVVFSRGETLMAAPFDPKTLTVTGDVTALSRGLRITEPWQSGFFGFSHTGILTFSPGGLVGADRRLVSFDAAGNATAFGTERRVFEKYPALSRDGQKIAVVIANEKGFYELWTADQGRPVLTRAIAIPNADCDGPHWSPDGKRLQFNRYARDKDDGVYVQNADGSGAPQLVMPQAIGTSAGANSWTADGSGLMVSTTVQGKNSVAYVAVPPAGAPLAAPRPLRSTPYNDGNAHLSLDGRFLAFESNESGKNEIHVALWGPDGMIGRPVQVSNGGGSGLDWAADSRSVFYANPDAKLMSATVDAKPGLTATQPVVVHDLRKLRVNGWNILPDGRLFAIQRSEAEDDTSTFNIVFNWFDELRAKTKR